MATIPGSFPDVFNKRLEAIELRALEVGLNLTVICAELHISRSTPDRWRRKIPRTVKIMDDMEKVVIAAEKRKSGSAKATSA
jgi:hypothetical protein